jgi:dUTP pyrophosphatase
MKIAITRTVRKPSRGTQGSAGLDFYVPEDAFPFGEIRLDPGQSVNIPSGVTAKVPKGYALIAFNKSGIALRRGLQVGACVVDEDYQGEIHLHVTNVSYEPTTVFSGQKLVQFLLVPISYESIEVVKIDELFSEGSERGTGGFGSTGNR